MTSRCCLQPDKNNPEQYEQLHSIKLLNFCPANIRKVFCSDYTSVTSQCCLGEPGASRRVFCSWGYHKPVQTESSQGYPNGSHRLIGTCCNVTQVAPVMGHLVCWIFIFFPPSSSGQLVTGWQVLTSRREPSALVRGLVRISNGQRFATVVPQAAP